MRLLFVIFILISFSCASQQNSQATNKKASISNDKPKLVVGIVVDQMRYDYLQRFAKRYGEGGFNRLLSGGYNCKNNHYNYVPTYTGPGHASIFTGTTPKYHGIIGNNWYDKQNKETVYCVSDSTVNAIGTTGYNGEMSPHRLKTMTFADENRLFTQMRGKTIGISLKDRGAVLPAGHTANAAYWFQGGEEGNWVTSSFYMDELPKWVKDFNGSTISESYIKEWNTLYDIETYTESGEDNTKFEKIFTDLETSEFPYNLEELKENHGQLGIIRETPFGNSLTADFALAALDGEQLGVDDHTDVLTISFSSTDYIGHAYGVNSKEIEDAYLRLDKDLERLLIALDKKVGAGNYTVFLTADHGAMDVSAYLQSARIPAGLFNGREFRTKISGFMANHFKADSLIENVSNNQVFFNYQKLKVNNIDALEAQNIIAQELIAYPFIDKVYTAQTINTNSFNYGIEKLIQLGYDQKRSGDVIFVYEPNIVSYGNTGSTHGTGFNYDTHVPLIFYGNGIAHGSTLQRTEITDIAPTISALLGISFPNASIGNPLEFVLKD